MWGILKPVCAARLFRVAAKYQDCVYLFSVGAILFIKCVLDKGMLSIQYLGNPFLRAMNLLLLIPYLLLAIKIAFFTKYTRPECVFVVIAAVIAGISYLGARELMAVRAFLIIAAGKNINFRRVLESALSALSLAAGLIILLFITNVTENVAVSNRADAQTLRYSLGFGHPNIFSGILLMICTLWFTVSYDKLRWWHYAGGISLLAYIYFIADSRSGEIGLVLLLALSAIGKRFHIFTPTKVWSRYLWIAVPLLAVASCALAVFYSYDQPISSALNKLLTGRIENLNAYYREFGFSWFGQEIYAVRPYMGEVLPSDMPMFDNAYVLMGIRFGLVPLAIYCASQALLLKRAKPCFRAELIICVLVVGIYSVVESHTAEICYNPALLALPALFETKAIGTEYTLFQKMRIWALQLRGGVRTSLGPYERRPSTGSGNRSPNSRS